MEDSHILVDCMASHVLYPDTLTKQILHFASAGSEDLNPLVQHSPANSWKGEYPRMLDPQTYQDYLAFERSAVSALEAFLSIRLHRRYLTIGGTKLCAINSTQGFVKVCSRKLLYLSLHSSLVLWSFLPICSQAWSPALS